jgi:hypothetical protein
MEKKENANDFNLSAEKLQDKNGRHQHHPDLIVETRRNANAERPRASIASNTPFQQR